MKQDISGTITRADGTESRFRITADGTSQWGANTDVLGGTVDLVTDMAAVARQIGFLDEPVLEDEGADVTVTAEQRAHFTEAITAAAKAADGDSNDEEIDSLWQAIDAACSVLGLNRDDFVD